MLQAQIEQVRRRRTVMPYAPVGDISCSARQRHDALAPPSGTKGIPMIFALLLLLAAPGQHDEQESMRRSVALRTATPPTTAAADGPERTLLHATTFRDSEVGEAGTTPPEVRAFRILLADPDAAARFRRIAAGGTVAGRLYAACAFFFLDVPVFDAEVARLRAARGHVERQQGCIVTQESVVEVVARRTGAPDLSHGGTYREWLRALRSLAAFDIPGGSQCYSLRYGTEAPVAWLEDPSLAPEFGPAELRRGEGR